MMRSICLDIPHPSWLMQLGRVPPVVLSTGTDAAAIKLIEDQRKSLGRSRQEIQHACDLAAGPRDIVIVLERPAWDHDYMLEFGEFVEKSPALRALNELILFATKSSRSIFTVSVIDAFSFQAKRKVPPQPLHLPSNSECLTLLGKFLRLKQPRIVLSCTSADIADQVEGCGALFIQSFHPGYPVNWRTHSARLRLRLIVDFIDAFRKLGTQPETETRITEMKAQYPQHVSDYPPDKLSAREEFTRRINRVLYKRYKLTIDISGFDKQLDKWSTDLQRSSYSDGSLQIADMVLLLKLCYNSPDESSPSGTVMAALIDIGLKQSILENQIRHTIGQRPLVTQVPEHTLESTKNFNEPAPEHKDLENTELSFQNLSVSPHTGLLVKTTPSAETSSMMSVVSEDAGGVVQKFADSGEEDTDVLQEKEVPRKRWRGRG
ncbi:hypothetical protein BDZ45DRAFT_680082 [Acephala macrosclerotiorum]|nr:hypothetical protein BDZ45DRAFT_680082 [Acephala macrosclerotiorum]